MAIIIDREAIFKKAKALPPNIAVIECEWDGDSSGWFVTLWALEETASNSYREHSLAQIGHGQGELYDFNRALVGAMPLYPEGQLAKEIGQEIANQLGVPFYFSSPDKPTLDEVPRWKDWRVGRTSSRPIRLIDPEPIIALFAGKSVAVVEVYWTYWHTYFPKLSVITVRDSDALQAKYQDYPVGELYWDERDMGRTIYDQHIPPHSPVEEAIRVGNFIASQLNVPFYFASPDQPSHNIPRWIPLQKKNE